MRREDIGKTRHLRGMSVDSIVNGLKPDEDPIDKRILFELAGVKLNDFDYAESSSSFSEDDEGQAI